MPKWDHLLEKDKPDGRPTGDPDFQLVGWHIGGAPGKHAAPKSEDAKDREVADRFARGEGNGSRRVRDVLKKDVKGAPTIRCLYGHKMHPEDRTRARGLCPVCLNRDGRKTRTFHRITAT